MRLTPTQFSIFKTFSSPVPYRIQAGREVRVVVNPQSVTDEQAHDIAKELRQRIESELQYPSTIKITVIRESRFTETAT